MTLRMLGQLTTDMVRELAVAEKVCVRPLVRRVLDRETGTESKVAIPCGATLESVCPTCAHKARVLRMHQCAEGWHLTTEPEHHHDDQDSAAQGNDDQEDDEPDDPDEDDGEGEQRRVRSTRRWAEMVDLPRVPVEDRTIGRAFTAPDGTQYRPSMFLTLTLPSYGPITGGAPSDPGSYNYRRAALDAVLFPKLVDRFWQNLRRCAGYRVQYFSAVEPQKRLAPHLHAALRGAIPRKVLRQVIAATYVQIWWPPCERPVYVHRIPEWDGAGYCDPDTGERLPTWDHTIDQLAADQGARPMHVMRFGRQTDIRGIIAPSDDADRAIRYLTKYLTKAVAEPLTTTAAAGIECSADDGESVDSRRDAHIDRLHEQLRWLPCSERCANWLRYGVEPKHPQPGLRPGHCLSKAHDRQHLGLGGRRVLVSRDWSGKTLTEHRADRATVVREALHAAGIVPPEVERMAADVTAQDGLPRFVWTDHRPDSPGEYRTIILASIQQRRAWHAQYETAKTLQPVDSRSATREPP